jgi:hypothetical protein
MWDKHTALVGKKITGIFRTDDSEFLKFSTDAGDVYFMTYADCCSETWVEEVLNGDLLIGHTVTACRDMDDATLPKYPPSERQEEDDTYGWQIDSDGGTAKVIYRNSSNGYYCGAIGLCNERFIEVCKARDAEWLQIA